MSGNRECACNAFKVTVLFPLADNDGRPFDSEIWRWWRDEMMQLQLAFTDTGVVQGSWEGQSEEHRSVFWIVRSKKEVARLRQFVAEAKERFEQKEMFFEWFPVRYEGV